MIKEIEDFLSFTAAHPSLQNCTLQNLDFRNLDVDWNSIEIQNTNFLGCTFDIADKANLVMRGARIFEADLSLPYFPFRRDLYHWRELTELLPGGQSRDLQIYQHFAAARFNPDINEALYQRIHDHAIDDALREFIGLGSDGMPQFKCVGMMGGHSTTRDSAHYRAVAQLAKKLTEHGFFVVSGGGPGIMEAANLGAYFAGSSEHDLDTAITDLAQAPHYQSAGFMETAVRVVSKYTCQAASLAIPTWFYGHEPSNLFATHIAKYFSNSIREDTLLAICLYGVIFAPGSAGTLQEVFMDLAQNYYQTYGWRSPMVFFQKEFFQQIKLDGLLHSFLGEHSYRDYIFSTNEADSVLSFLKTHPPTNEAI